MRTIQPNLACVWFVFHNEKSLLLKKVSEELTLPSNVTVLESSFSRKFKLGTLNNVDCICAELTSDFPFSDFEEYEAVPLRQTLDILGNQWFNAISKAFSIINWDKNHQFCGRCGSVTVLKTELFERVCTNCHLPHFPRISPSIIVLIKNGNKILMARSPHFAPGIYGLIAGFVESGETVEEAVQREVKEEVNIKIKNISYFGSQFWPFPDSLMLGFIADYEDGEIKIDGIEIEDADWYTIDNLPKRPSSSVSIASKMISNFIEEQKKAYAVP